MKSIFKYILMFLLCAPLFGVAQHAHDHEDDFGLKFQENKGQWPDQVLFSADVGTATVFLEENGLLFNVASPDDMADLSAAHHGDKSLFPDSIDYHAFRIDFYNGQKPTRVFGAHAFSDYLNFYRGNDPSKWASEVRQFGEVIYENIYPNIDFRVYSLNEDLKYEFIVHPEANADLIALEFKYVDALELSDQNLMIKTSVTEIVDKKPVSWSGDGEDRKYIESFYKLEGNGDNPLVRFELSNYSKFEELVIDPTLIFSTLTGSTTDNWGSTATYDSLGNMYAGGIAFGNGYPTTTGAYSTSFTGTPGGLNCDISISKFNSIGTSLIYSTYIGGSSSDMAHSLVVNENLELYILGTTSSSNYPTTNGAYDGTFNGGNNIPSAPNSSANTNSIPYPNGSDIVVTKLNSTGTNLLGSTYIGGSSNDGLNRAAALVFNYSDEFRGEIIVDATDEIYVVSSTLSNNFPTVSGYQSAIGGGQDAVAFKFNSNLTNLLWSSYFGGNGDDAGYSCQFDANTNDVYFTGGTTSPNLPATGLNTNYQGGASDGYIAQLSANGQNLLACTYLGTNGYDQSYFVQLDLQGYVYSVGQTDGNYPVGPNWVYSNPNSGQFIHKLTSDLQNTEFSTVFGTGSGDVDISPTAFLVNECNHIFVSAWGGITNNNNAPITTSTTTGLPITNNAYQTTTDGSDFYFVVFEDSATSLLFASFFGGAQGGPAGQEHVDGGTSRFDKKGIIYQAVCANCGTGQNTQLFPTYPNPGAYSNAEPDTTSCNLGAIKYDLVTLEAEADVDGPTNVCVNDTLFYNNASIGGSLYYWEFGDGDTSNLFEPSHVFDSVGTYETMLVIFDSVSCIKRDTDYITINVITGPTADVQVPDEGCPGDAIQLNVSGGTSYKWIPSAGLNDDEIANPIATLQESKTYLVQVIDSCGIDTASVPVLLFSNETDAIEDTSLCGGLSGELWARGGVSYFWTPGTYLSDQTIPNPIVEPDSSIKYNLQIIDSFDCERNYQVDVYVDGFIPVVEAKGDTSVCSGDRVILSAQGTHNYEWFPKGSIIDPFLNMTPAYPDTTTHFVVRSFNSCGSNTDTVLVKIIPVGLEINADTAVCLGDSAQLWAKGAVGYSWEGPFFGDTKSYNPAPKVRPKGGEWYYATARNLVGCEATDSVFVDIYETPEIEITTLTDTITGLHPVNLKVESEYPTLWSSVDEIACPTCDSIVVAPLYRTWYIATATTDKGCTASDSIAVQAISTLYVPNTFTPDQDGNNEIFRVYGHNILSFEIIIYDRWGHEVYRSEDINEGWDGSKFNRGRQVQIGTYTYVIRYTVLPEKEEFRTGKINVLR